MSGAEIARSMVNKASSKNRCPSGASPCRSLPSITPVPSLSRPRIDRPKPVMEPLIVCTLNSASSTDAEVWSIILMCFCAPIHFEAEASQAASTSTHSAVNFPPPTAPLSNASTSLMSLTAVFANESKLTVKTVPSRSVTSMSASESLSITTPEPSCRSSSFVSTPCVIGFATFCPSGERSKPRSNVIPTVGEIVIPLDDRNFDSMFVTSAPSSSRSISPLSTAIAAGGIVNEYINTGTRSPPISKLSW